MKYLYLIAVMIIVAITVDKIEDAISNDVFVHKTTVFMKKGGRNTSDQGIALCQRMNRIEAFHDIKATDCESVYR